MFCNALKAGSYNKGWQVATDVNYISSQLQGRLSNTNSDQILRRHMLFNTQHQAEGGLQYGWRTASCLLQKELPAGCVFATEDLIKTVTNFVLQKTPT